MVVGQPELKKKLQQPKLAQFSQRIAVSYHLSPLTRKECCEYIAHRLISAGGAADIFLQGAMDSIYENSGGIPRTINLLCDACLVYGFADEIPKIGEYIVQQVIDDQGGMGIITGSWEQASLSASASRERSAIRFVPLDELGEQKAVDSHDRCHEGLLEKMTFVEEKVRELEAMLLENKTLLTKKLDTIQKEEFQQIARMLIAERKQNAKLLLDYGRLHEKYQALKKKVRQHTLS